MTQMETETTTSTTSGVVSGPVVASISSLAFLLLLSTFFSIYVLRSRKRQQNGEWSDEDGEEKRVGNGGLVKSAFLALRDRKRKDTAVSNTTMPSFVQNADQENEKLLVGWPSENLDIQDHPKADGWILPPVCP